MLSRVLEARARLRSAERGMPIRVISYLGMATRLTADAYLVAKRNDGGYGFG